MTHPLIDLTEQEIFNEAYLGLKSQNFEFSGESGNCRYTLCGKRCAIGWACAGSFLPLEGTIPTRPKFWESLGINFESVDSGRTSFLRTLQYTHDFALGPANMEKKLLDFAENEGLTVPD